MLTTFTNPNPASVSGWYFFGDWFGSAIATLGRERVLIGSPLDRKVYLFTTNGALVSTISGPQVSIHLLAIVNPPAGERFYRLAK